MDSSHRPVTRWHLRNHLLGIYSYVKEHVYVRFLYIFFVEKQAPLSCLTYCQLAYIMHGRLFISLLNGAVLLLLLLLFFYYPKSMTHCSFHFFSSIRILFVPFFAESSTSNELSVSAPHRLISIFFRTNGLCAHSAVMWAALHHNAARTSVFTSSLSHCGTPSVPPILHPSVFFSQNCDSRQLQNFHYRELGDGMFG